MTGAALLSGESCTSGEPLYNVRQRDWGVKTPAVRGAGVGFPEGAGSRVQGSLREQ